MSNLNWSAINTVFLDMDGTLLDLHFDNHFWLHYVPKCYAEKHQMPFQDAHDLLMAKYKTIEGTINWYCIDHWTEELGLDIMLLKREVAHLIKLHPFVIEFLTWLKLQGKQRVLVTNAHQKSLSLKLQKTPLANHLDTVISAHELSLPKEETDFWTKLQSIYAYSPEQTLLIDDNLSVLNSARNYGIENLLAIYKPDSQLGIKEVKGFKAINSFKEIMIS